MIYNISQILDSVIEGFKINNSIDFPKMCLGKERVVVIPGDGFDVNNYIKIS